MAWQRADPNIEASENHLPFTRCSSVIALSFQSRSVALVKQGDTRGTRPRNKGEVFDPFSPYKVLKYKHTQIGAAVLTVTTRPNIISTVRKCF